MSIGSVARVLEALSLLYSANNAQSRQDANSWLENFQKQPEAWIVADYLLRSQDTNIETKHFAAQTFRQKVTYDLRDLDHLGQIDLRDSLVDLLWVSISGPKVITIQLCLAVADLAIQITSWEYPVQDIMQKFGKSPEAYIVLLEFLKVLPEELSGNSRLPLSDIEFQERSDVLVKQNSKQVIKLLAYMDPSEGNVDLQDCILRCLCSWLRTGNMDIEFVKASPLLEIAFRGLASEDLVEVCTDVVCEIIHETKELVKSRSLIKAIQPYFATILEYLKDAKAEANTEKVRGFCRIFIEAGEAYVPLVVKYPDHFCTILDGVAECTAYDDLDIVQMTFKFWCELTCTLISSREHSDISVFNCYYDALVDTLINHLHYPPTMASWTAKERDDFREFRHKMGDTLKDCCRILSPQRCLSKPLGQLKILVAQQASWQQIEAPIFSLRAMGSEVPANEDQVMPHIMELLSKIPDHPKTRYAATLVISRYSFWTRLHPEYITYQLNFISAGFRNNEVVGASALALKNLCRDCSELLVDYVSQLHLFYLDIGQSVSLDDAFEVTKAVAHVMAALPTSKVYGTLQLFCLPLAQDLHAIVSKDNAGLCHKEIIKAGGRGLKHLLSQIGIYFDIVRLQIPNNLPHPCIGFLGDIWPVFDLCFWSLGTVKSLADSLCRVFEHAIRSYKLHFCPFLPQLMERIVHVFEKSGLSIYLWIATLIVKEYTVEGTDSVPPCFGLVERLSSSLFTKLNQRTFGDMPDVIEHYFRLVAALLDRAPTPLVQSHLLPSVFQAGLAGLALQESNTITAVLIFYRRLLGITLSVDELSPNQASRVPFIIGLNGPRILCLFKASGNSFFELLFCGLLNYYQWDIVPDVASLLRSISQLLPFESMEWTIRAVTELSEQSLSITEKRDFLGNYAKWVIFSLW
ncbi:armadillo-type protein [Phycomyces nitens]|nr:armadillo-type protein [Phycomyces nitens]